MIRCDKGSILYVLIRGNVREALSQKVMYKPDEAASCAGLYFRLGEGDLVRKNTAWIAGLTDLGCTH